MLVKHTPREIGLTLDTPLNASANSAGAIFSNNTFEIPRFQREYSWSTEEITDFWNDLRSSLDSESYFLGLIILTRPQHLDGNRTDRGGEAERKQVVDGQQRLITLSLLANAIYHEAIASDRKALADRIQASFLRSIDYETDAQIPRVRLSEASDDLTFQTILATGRPPAQEGDDESVSAKIVASHNLLSRELSADLRADPFKRLGKWADFIINHLYFAVFLHHSPDAAYQVYEVVNTRGKDLNTADLLKNFVLSQAGLEQDVQYERWQAIAKRFTNEGSNNFVQYIRHVVTVNSGYILPRDLYTFIAARRVNEGRPPPRPNELMRMLEQRLPLYQQMIDPTNAGPADIEALGVFSALNSLSVLNVRPILLACAEVGDSTAGMEWILRLVVRRIVVGNLGTGAVERRFGEAAKAISDSGDWRIIVDLLNDLNPSRDDFISQLKKRSFNKQLLGFVRKSIIQNTITPSSEGFLHFIWTKAPEFGGMGENEGAGWASTIGNTMVAGIEKRPRTVMDWPSFKEVMLPAAAGGEWVHRLAEVETWDVAAVEAMGEELAEAAGQIWYND